MRYALCMDHPDHKTQQTLWNQEHQTPHMLLPMDQQDASGGVVRFYEWLQTQSLCSPGMKGIEMGCGKGRNSIWLASQGVHMSAFDFSEAAIAEAQQRSTAAEMTDMCNFRVADATQHWDHQDHSFDIAIDCFASSDIEDATGRAFARDEFARVLKKGSHFFVYAISTQSPFHAKMLKESPGREQNSFLHPGGKFEKVYDEEELLNFYSNFDVLEKQLLTRKNKVMFYGEEYDSINYFLILRNR